MHACPGVDNARNILYLEDRPAATYASNRTIKCHDKVNFRRLATVVSPPPLRCTTAPAKALIYNAAVRESNVTSAPRLRRSADAVGVSAARGGRRGAIWVDGWAWSLLSHKINRLS